MKEIFFVKLFLLDWTFGNRTFFQRFSSSGPSVDLFKEIWIGATFFWKMVEILGKGILNACKEP